MQDREGVNGLVLLNGCGDVEVVFALNVCLLNAGLSIVWLNQM